VTHVASFPPPGMTLALLDRGHRRKRFSSGDPRVDGWLIHRALGAMEKQTSTTRVLVQADATVAGYYTLAVTALDVSLVPPALFGGTTPTHAPPTLTLAWLGVDQRFTGRGLGTKLFARALADCAEVHHLVRFVAVVVDALTADNFAFYLKMGFLPVPGTTNKLYMAAATLMQVTRPPDHGP
jgi:GNAT superfamily N-acetyltransferase